LDVSVFVVCLLLIRLHIPLWIFLPLPAPLQRSSPARPHPHKPSPAAASEPTNRHVMMGHASTPKSDQSRTDQGSSIRARLRLADLRRPGGLPGAKTQDAWGRTRDRKPHAKTKGDAAAMVIEANRELTPPSCSPLFCHRIYQPPSRIGPRSGPVRPTTVPWIPPNSFVGGTAQALSP